MTLITSLGPGFRRALERSGLSPTQEPGDPVRLSLGECFEPGESLAKFPGLRTEGARPGAHLAESGHCQHAPRGEPIDHGLVESQVPEHVTYQQIDVRTFGESLIEIEDIEVASVGHAADRGKSAGEVDGHRGDIDTEDAHSTLGQPYRQPTLATGDFQGVSSRREVVFERGEDLRKTGSTD